MGADSPETLAKFRDKHQLNFPLACDTDHKALHVYGVWQEKTLYGKKSMGIVRSTYIIDQQGRVKAVFRRVQVDGHIGQVLAALRL